MTAIIDLAPVDRLEITTLIDNETSLLLRDTPMMKRRWWRSAENPLAGHGLSLLVETWRERAMRSVLLDPGYPLDGVRHNWRVFGFDPNQVDALLVSHGHYDHHEALRHFIRARDSGLPVVLHPYALEIRSERARHTSKGDVVYRPPLPSREALRNLGAEVIATKEPHMLTNGLASTGEVPRVTDFEGLLVDGQWRKDETWDDQSMVAHLKDRGLVVMSGCAHAGIINTILHAQAITGVERVFAVIGGFHLARATARTLDGTISAMKELDPALIVPTHCTGFEPQHAFAKALPDAFALNAVGTRIVLPARPTD